MDKRALDSRPGGFKSKVRVLSRPSTLLPPPNPPSWSVTKECLQLSDATTTPTSHSDVISMVEVQTSSSTSTPVTMPRNIVQRRLSMSDSSITTAVHQDSVTINDNSVTTYASEVTPTHLTQEDDDDIDTDSDSSSSSSSD